MEWNGPTTTVVGGDYPVSTKYKLINKRVIYDKTDSISVTFGITIFLHGFLFLTDFCCIWNDHHLDG